MKAKELKEIVETRNRLETVNQVNLRRRGLDLSATILHTRSGPSIGQKTKLVVAATILWVMAAKLLAFVSKRYEPMGDAVKSA